MLVEQGTASIVRSHGHAERGLASMLAVQFPIADLTNLRSMVETGQSIVIPDTHCYPGWVTRPETRWVCLQVGAPIRVKAQVIGFLNLDSATPNFFTQAHAERLQAFANQAAITIENARLYATEQQRADALAQALDQQRELDRLQREFTQNVSHELRTPPMAVLSGQDESLFKQHLQQLARVILDYADINLDVQFHDAG